MRQTRTRNDPGEQLADRLRMKRFALGVGEHRVTRPDPVPVAALAIAPSFKDAFGVDVEFEATPTGACLGGKLGGPSSECLTGTADRQLVQASVPVAPPQPGDLAATHPGGGSEMQRRIEPMPAGSTEERCELGSCPCLRTAARACVRSRPLGAERDVGAGESLLGGLGRALRTMRWTSWTVLAASPSQCWPPVAVSVV